MNVFEPGPHACYKMTLLLTVLGGNVRSGTPLQNKQTNNNNNNNKKKLL